jgi:hypothetical protein
VDSDDAVVELTVELLMTLGMLASLRGHGCCGVSSKSVTSPVGLSRCLRGVCMPSPNRALIGSSSITLCAYIELLAVADPCVQPENLVDSTSGDDAVLSVSMVVVEKWLCS